MEQNKKFRNRPTLTGVAGFDKSAAEKGVFSMMLPGLLNRILI